MTQRSAGLTADAAGEPSRASDPGGPQRDPHGLGKRAMPRFPVRFRFAFCAAMSRYRGSLRSK